MHLSLRVSAPPRDTRLVPELDSCLPIKWMGLWRNHGTQIAYPCGISHVYCLRGAPAIEFLLVASLDAAPQLVPHGLIRQMTMSALPAALRLLPVTTIRPAESIFRLRPVSVALAPPAVPA